MALCWVPQYVLSQCTPDSEGTGSIQFIARRQDLVWGSGLLISDQYQDTYREVLKQVALEQALRARPPRFQDWLLAVQFLAVSVLHPPHSTSMGVDLSLLPQ